MTRARERHVEERLAAFLAGEPPAAEAREVEAHLAICDPCRRAYAELTALRATLAGDPTPEPLRPVWPSIVGTLNPAQPARFAFRLRVALAGVAGIVLGVLVGASRPRAGAEPLFTLWSSVGSSLVGDEYSSPWQFPEADEEGGDP